MENRKFTRGEIIHIKLHDVANVSGHIRVRRNVKNSTFCDIHISNFKMGNNFRVFQVKKGSEEIVFRCNKSFATATLVCCKIEDIMTNEEWENERGLRLENSLGI